MRRARADWCLARRSHATRCADAANFCTIWCARGCVYRRGLAMWAVAGGQAFGCLLPGPSSCHNERAAARRDADRAPSRHAAYRTTGVWATYHLPISLLFGIGRRIGTVRGRGPLPLRSLWTSGARQNRTTPSTLLCAAPTWAKKRVYTRTQRRASDAQTTPLSHKPVVDACSGISPLDNADVLRVLNCLPVAIYYQPPADHVACCSTAVVV